MTLGYKIRFIFLINFRLSEVFHTVFHTLWKIHNHMCKTVYFTKH